MRFFLLLIVPVLFFGCKEEEVSWNTPTSLDSYFMDELNKYRESKDLTTFEFNAAYFEEAKRFAANLADNPMNREQLTKEEEENGYHKKRIQSVTGSSDLRGCTAYAAYNILDPIPDIVNIMASRCRNTLENRNSNTFGGAVFQNAATGDYFYVVFTGRLDN
ncbi:hypothetical protein KMW28_09285 [Flammeovirga yaeyamensis]|uniref:SCP domain-containing protein n=1 Tax=Flammeovirga yaeyamensis TaxID=367791 RepID=A0AAX1N8I1_9BACT|nr:hypothetical protein [Flammeovirga yaeyamensis]MBB3698848.1 hypothetical protein [Flammeovirga yaeyamensis]NMF37433.1 hypothetical protein [Flammeovirga yaeyamensis]QWG03754.1 hypothetical protein KMW28_09285 [Flammeovirga yaeyamensis]